MINHGFVEMDLLDKTLPENPADRDAQLLFRRLGPLGFIDSDTDNQVEVAERFGLLPELLGDIRRLIAYARTEPGTIEAEALDTRKTNGDHDLRIIGRVGLKGESFLTGVIVISRDSEMEYEMRRVSSQVFADQLKEIMTIYRVHPNLEIRTNLTFKGDKGAA